MSSKEFANVRSQPSSSKDGSRNVSGGATGEYQPNQGRNGESRYWDTVMGRSYGSGGSTSQASTNSSQNMQVQVSRTISGLKPTASLWQDSGRGSTDFSQNSVRSNRQFPCTLCDARFERRGHLQSHIDTVHERKRPYACPEGCGKVFGHRSSLSRHIRTAHETSTESQSAVDHIF